MMRSKKVILALGAAALLVLGFGIWNHKGLKALPEPLKPVRTAVSDHKETLESPATPAEKTVLSSSAETTPGGARIIEREISIIHDSPKLKRYRQLAKKVLTRAEDRNELEALWSDPAAFADAKKALLREDPASLTEANQLTRIRVIDYLAKAAAWQENPKADEVKGLLVDLVKHPISNAQLDEAGRRARASDRMELYYVLKKNFPEAAQELREHAAAYGLGKLLAYAEEHESQHNTVVVER